MAIINRSLGESEQKEAVQANVKNTVTATNYVVHRAQRPQEILAAKAYAAGLSGSPTSTLYVERFVVGTGGVTYAVGGALTHTAFGTSGAQAYSLPASGSSLLQLQAGDVVRVLTGTANTAATDLSVQIVLKNLNDIKGWD